MKALLLLFAALATADARADHSSGNLAKSESPDDTYSPDFKLLETWSPEGQQREECTPPFVATYSDGQRTLSFVAARHEAGETSTTRLLRKTAAAVKPDILLVEGVPSEFGESPESIQNQALACLAQDKARCSERDFAIAVAHERKIPFMGAEASMRDIVTHMKARFSDEDIAGYLVTRDLAQELERGKPDPERLASGIEKYQRLELAPGLVPMAFKILSETEYRAWFKKTFQQELSFDRRILHSQLFAPSTAPKAHLLQRMSADEETLRDRHILKVTAKALKTYKNVMIQYGSGHHVAQRKVLRKMLPNYSCSQ